jgi:glycoside/pentoside/hexuronide:cation symporter, GPH family
MNASPDSVARALPLNKTQAVLYAAPWNAYSFIMLPLGVVLPTYYAEATLAGMAAIGFVSGIARLFDAITDPLIGYVSDRTRTRWGARKPWIVLGSLIACGAIFFLFQPPADAGIVYYAVGSFALYLGYTLFDIPHKAWYAEVALDYNDRSRIAGYVAVFTVLGSILFWVVPVALSPLTGNTRIGPESFRLIAWLFVVVLPLSVIGAVLFVPNGRTIAVQDSPLRELFKSLRRNKPFWRFLAAVSLWGVGQGMSFSVVFIVMRDYLGLADQFAVLMIVFFVVQFVAMPLWAKIMMRYGKHRAWAVSWGFGALWGLLLLFLKPGSAPFWPALLLISVSAAVNGASYIAPRAVLGDIIDYDLLRSKRNNGAKYFSFNTLLDKSLIGLGVGAAFPLLSAFGYQIGAQNDQTATFGLLFCYLGVPLVTHTAAAALLWNFPLDARRHGIIRRRIEQLTARREIVLG